MKKFHDVKPRKKKILLTQDVKKSHYDKKRDDSPNFWHGLPEKKSFKPKDFSNLYRKIVSVTVLISMIFIVFGRAYTVSAELEVVAFKAKEHLENCLEHLQDNKQTLAIKEAQVARDYLQLTKKNLQAWGQNSHYMQLVSYESRYVEIERLVNSAEILLGLAKRIDETINSYSDALASVEFKDEIEINIPLEIDRISKMIDDTQKEIDILSKIIAEIGFADQFFSREEVERLQKMVKIINQSLDNFNKDIMPILKWFCAYQADREIMILFQNNAELRGSGGFIGSFALASLTDGLLKKIDFQTNIYKLDKSAENKVKIDAPDEFKVLAKGKMYLRDSNYAIDGPESLATVREFYSLESGREVDGIMALDTTLFTSLLGAIGPIYLEKYNLEIRQDNFLEDVQYEVERDYFLRDGGKEENEPKQILADLMPIFINKVISGLKNDEQRNKILSILSDSLTQKHLIFYSSDNEVQSKINELNIGADVRSNNDYDYFYSHSTNIGGGKSSLNINESVIDNIHIEDVKKIYHDVEIVREHAGSGEWPDHDNTNLLRILLPEDALFKSLEKIEGDFMPNMENKYIYKIGTEAKRQKISFWMNTLIQSKSRINLKYQSSLGVKKTDEKYVYYLLIQKQPGTLEHNYKINISLSEKFSLLPTNSARNIEFDINLDSDKLIKLEFEDNK